jgi:hypothetical protein
VRDNLRYRVHSKFESGPFNAGSRIAIQEAMIWGTDSVRIRWSLKWKLR